MVPKMLRPVAPTSNTKVVGAEIRDGSGVQLHRGHGYGVGVGMRGRTGRTAGCFPPRLPPREPRDGSKIHHIATKLGVEGGAEAGVDDIRAVDGGIENALKSEPDGAGFVGRASGFHSHVSGLW